MRWRSKQKLIIRGVFVIDFILIFLVWYTNQDVATWITLLGVEFAVTIHSLFTYFRAGPQYDKDKLNHSKKLIREVFEKPIVPASVVYDFDEIHKTDVQWTETNPCFDFAINHLKNKKYKKTWQAYINGKQNSDLLLNKIVSKIEKYRRMVKHSLHDEALNIVVREKEQYLWGKSVYDQKYINHIIYYEVIKKYMSGTSDKKLALFPVDPKNNVYCLMWWDYYPDKGMVNGENVALGFKKYMEHVKNMIEKMTYDEKIKNVISDINNLILCLKDDPNLNIFEAGRKEIVKQVNIIKEPLAGKCNRCP